MGLGDCYAALFSCLTDTFALTDCLCSQCSYYDCSSVTETDQVREETYLKTSRGSAAYTCAIAARV